MRRPSRLQTLRDVAHYLRMESASFSRIGQPAGPVRMEDGTPVTEANVTAFIRERTRIWRHSWVEAPLAEVIKAMEAARVRK